jgi:hypothetical protein
METKLVDKPTPNDSSTPSLSSGDWRKLIKGIEVSLQKFDLRIEHMEDLRQSVNVYQAERSTEIAALRSDFKKELSQLCTHMDETRKMDYDLVVTSVKELCVNNRTTLPIGSSTITDTTNSLGSITAPVSSTPPPPINDWVHNVHPTHPSRGAATVESSEPFRPTVSHDMSDVRLSNDANLGNRLDTRKKNILILRDSLLGEFDGKKFSYLFKTDCEKISTLENALMPVTQRLIRSKEATDCIVIQLGINDLRDASVNAVIGRMKQLLNDLSSIHNIPIVVCKLLPSLDYHLNDKIRKFNVELERTISQLPSSERRNSSVTLNKCGRFWDLNRDTLKEFFKSYDRTGIHINTRGVAMLSNSIKYALASVFNVSIQRQRSEMNRSRNF